MNSGRVYGYLIKWCLTKPDKSEISLQTLTLKRLGASPPPNSKIVIKLISYKVYTRSMKTIYLFMRAQVAVGIFFMKSPVSKKISPLTYPEKSWLFLKHSKEALCKKNVKGKKVYILAKDVKTEKQFKIKAKQNRPEKGPFLGAP